MMNYMLGSAIAGTALASNPTAPAAAPIATDRREPALKNMSGVITPRGISEAKEAGKIYHSLRRASLASSI
jgi:hypothetical protein